MTRPGFLQFFHMPPPLLRIIVAILAGPFLTLSTDGKALPNINQIPVFAAGANINTQPKPQPAIQFEASPIKFGSRKISKEPVRIQTPQAEPERVRSQQVYHRPLENY